MKKRIALFSLIGVLISAGFLFSQGSVTEIMSPELVYRMTDPIARVTGNLRHLGGSVAYRNKAIVTAATTLTLTESDCGGVIVANHTTATQTFTLPGVANTGCMLTFIAGNAGTEILINAAAVATCVHTHFAAVGADADTAIVTDASCEVGMKNTAATNAIGDTLTLVSDGTRWLGVGITSGIWASQ